MPPPLFPSFTLVMWLNAGPSVGSIRLPPPPPFGVVCGWCSEATNYHARRDMTTFEIDDPGQEMPVFPIHRSGTDRPLSTL